MHEESSQVHGQWSVGVMRWAEPRPFKKIVNRLIPTQCKNNHAKILNSFAAGNFSKIKLKSGRGLATPRWVLNHARQNFQKYQLNAKIPTQCKII